MIRAGVSGTNWTGKSVTLRTFVERHPDLRIDTVVLSDLLRRCPYLVVAEQTPDTSRWILEQVGAILNAPVDVEIQLFDRSPIDILAFTQYAFDRDKCAVDRSLMAAIHDLIGEFDSIFYAPISEQWPTGVSPEPQAVAFALLMDRYMHRAINEYKIDVVDLPWRLSDRQAVLSRHLSP